MITPQKPSYRHYSNTIIRAPHFGASVVLLLLLTGLLLWSLLHLAPPSLQDDQPIGGYFSQAPFNFAFSDPAAGLPAVGLTAAVSTEHPLCSAIGLRVIKEGGNAVDAAIASAICIGTVNCFSSGIGGGGFMLIRPSATTSNSTGTQAVSINFRETAPAKATKTMFRNANMSQFGGLSVAIPGEVRGFEVAHKMFGSVPWRRLFEPSIKLAREGFTVSALLEDRITEDLEHILKSQAFAEVFAPGGVPLKQGETIYRRDFADTLALIAEQGPDAFYSGRIADSLVRQIQSTGGVITKEDLAGYKPRVEDALVGYYHGRKVMTTGAPSSGPILLSILNILEGYRLTMPQSAVDRHRLVEAFKFGYAQRTRLGDIHYLPDDVVDRIAEFTLKDTAAHIRHRINDDRTQPVDYYGAEYAPVDSPGTTHISTVDGQDMAVSITSTINLSFGSKLYNADTGIILNNEMDDFSSPNITNYFGLRPSKNNFITPGKRPLSSAVPTIIERDGVFEMAIGASGGSKITTAVVQAILNQLEYGMNVQQAVSAPRLHHQLLPHEVWMEQPMDESAEVDLTLRGHAVVRKQDLADVQAVVRLPSGVVHGGADPRKNGHAAAF